MKNFIKIRVRGTYYLLNPASVKSIAFSSRRDVISCTITMVCNDTYTINSNDKFNNTFIKEATLDKDNVQNSILTLLTSGKEEVKEVHDIPDLDGDW
jgi:hypothetical protein